MKAFQGIQISLSGTLDIACNNTCSGTIIRVNNGAIPDIGLYFPDWPGFKNTQQQHCRTR